MIHDHDLIKSSRVISLDKITSTKICSILISKVQNKTSSNIYLKIYLMAVILTVHQSIYYHALSRIIPICNRLGTES